MDLISMLIKKIIAQISGAALPALPEDFRVF